MAIVSMDTASTLINFSRETAGQKSACRRKGSDEPGSLGGGLIGMSQREAKLLRRCFLGFPNPVQKVSRKVEPSISMLPFGL